VLGCAVVVLDQVFGQSAVDAAAGKAQQHHRCSEPLGWLVSRQRLGQGWSPRIRICCITFRVCEVALSAETGGQPIEPGATLSEVRCR
jgi:hypothetical protein